MNKFELVATFTQMLTAFMFVRSGFYMIRVRKDFDRVKFWLMMLVVMTGTGMTLYNLSYPDYVLQRFPFNAIFFLGVAWFFYEITKAKKEDLYSIANVLKHQHTLAQKKVLHKINYTDDDKIQIVTGEDLEKIEKHVYIETSPSTMLLRINPPLDSGYDFKFRADMLPGGFFVNQLHPKLKEIIEVDFGLVVDLATDKIYRAGDRIIIEPGKPHFIKAIDRSGISAYLKRV